LALSAIAATAVNINAKPAMNAIGRISSSIACHPD
jgi:hypothetical protein